MKRVGRNSWVTAHDDELVAWTVDEFHGARMREILAALFAATRRA